MYYDNDFAIVVPMANEEHDFYPFIHELSSIMDKLHSGTVYFIIDKVSKDRTMEMCKELSAKDKRFKTIWAPENKHLVEAYLRGYKEAYDNGHEIIIEMDAGLSHDPKAIPMFLRVLNEGNECAFGSRFTNGGSIQKSNIKRHFFSRGGTILANLLLGTSMFDMTSGFQGFHRNIVGKILSHKFRSKFHFFQTELRYILRKTRFAEIPIHYQSPSPRVSHKAVQNALSTLIWLFWRRLTFQAISYS